jgi:hypothetical protein
MKNRTTHNKKYFGSSLEKDYYCSNCKLELSNKLLKAFKTYKQASKRLCPFCLKSGLKRREGSLQLTGVLV